MGRRFASVTTTTGVNAALRDGLDQKFAGYYLTGGYKMDAHTFLIRYDFMNYNSNSDGNTASYTATPGTDYTPKYKETTFGYTYAFNPGVVKSANIKLNYILRSKNFLKPFGTETSKRWEHRNGSFPGRLRFPITDRPTAGHTKGPLPEGPCHGPGGPDSSGRFRARCPSALTGQAVADRHHHQIHPLVQMQLDVEPAQGRGVRIQTRIRGPGDPAAPQDVLSIAIKPPGLRSLRQAS